MIEQFKSYFNDVFSSDMSVKACGRGKCIRLIELANMINPSVDFGNKDTGIMNIENIISLEEQLV